MTFYESFIQTAGSIEHTTGNGRLLPFVSPRSVKTSLKRSNAFCRAVGYIFSLIRGPKDRRGGVLGEGIYR